mgnify:CR=1 FL=1
MAAKIFKIRDFLKNGTFLKDFLTENISCFLKENSNESFGKDIVMYYFYFKGYDISFIYDESKGILKGEQIEISKHYEKLPKPTSIAIREWLDDEIYFRKTDK